MSQWPVRPEDLPAVQRTRDAEPLVEVSGYCNSQGCPGRQLSMVVKDYDDELVKLLRRRGLRCPLCSKPMLFDGVLGLSEYRARDEHAARVSVNQQMFIRDAGGFPVLTEGLLRDDRLPPTPEGWFAKEAL
jgi:hypothetical protein